jgi:hypothetical protein
MDSVSKRKLHDGVLATAFSAMLPVTKLVVIKVLCGDSVFRFGWDGEGEMTLV